MEIITQKSVKFEEVDQNVLSNNQVDLRSGNESNIVET